MGKDKQVGDLSYTFETLRSRSSKEFFSDPSVNLKAVGDGGQSVLHEAIAFRKHDVAEELIRRRIAVNSQDTEGKTPLHYAAIFGARALVGPLLDAGADPNVQDEHGNGAAWYAAMSSRGDYAIVTLLVSRGADIERKNHAGRSLKDFAQQSANKWLCSAIGIE